MTKTNLLSEANKSLCFFYSKVMQKLKELDHRRGFAPIPFPDINRKLSLFGLNKQETWELLKDLEREGLVRIIPFRGVRIVSDGDGK